MVIVSYGGGTDSTALLVEAWRRGLHVDGVFFADTGSEHPRTYEFLPVFDSWLQEHGMPGITIVRWIRQDGRFTPLHEDCLAKATLPSRAFGHSGCTSKWKQAPLDAAVDAFVDARGYTGLVERWVGYDVDEGRRVRNLAEKNRTTAYSWRAPLFEWRIDREQAQILIRAAGLPLPGKSSCFMCPSMRASEVRALHAEYPELAETAVYMESQAVMTTITDPAMQIRGLGMGTGGKSWGQVLSEPAPDNLDDEDDVSEDMPCGCAD